MDYNIYDALDTVIKRQRKIEKVLRIMAQELPHDSRKKVLHILDDEPNRKKDNCQTQDLEHGKYAQRNLVTMIPDFRKNKVAHS